MTVMGAVATVANLKQLVGLIFEGRRKLRQHRRNRDADSSTVPKEIFPYGGDISGANFPSPVKLTTSGHGRLSLAESESDPPTVPAAQAASTTAAAKNHQLRAFETSANDTAYIADHSILQGAAGGGREPDVSMGEPSFLPDTPKTLAMILQVSEADILPAQPLRGALIDSFFGCLADGFPMIEREEVESPRASVLLQQAVCFAGSLTRPSSPQWSLVDTKTLYDKVMLLISLNYERNTITILKAMCLMTLWSPKSPNRASDCVLSMIFGRPPLLRSEDLDIPVLTKDDYNVLTKGAQVFMADMLLARIMGQIAELTSKGCLTPQQRYHFNQSLKTWVRDLPPEIRLYTQGTRMPYHFASIEVHIAYLGTIILLQVLTPGSGKQPICSITSIIAAVTMADLYEDILCRDQAPYLTAVHGFFCTVAAIPLLQYRAASPEWETRRVASLDVISSVVSNLQNKFGVAFTASRKIAQLKSDRACAIEPQHPAIDTSPQPANRRLAAHEIDELEALFPSLGHWCPGLETIAAGMDAENVQGSMTPNMGSWNLDTLLREPRSILDELGGPSAFMDTLFDSNDAFGDMAFEDATVQSFESRGDFQV
ncbi:hypothetical protein LTR84_007641 [Exophiala bonariae]|uniref:Transcription factor domain-containing protein n=1 Tax=Exophiala bonariae TaxID=1690606 RepID=A0AAV9NP96_9EURO|nr:hypothetical protein LTR84_007641 [Exophiala bonariae]